MTIALDGELDLSSRDLLIDSAQDALHHPVETLDIDAYRLSFVDATGLTALLNIRQRADDSGVGFHLINVPPAARRTMEMAGMDEALLMG